MTESDRSSAPVAPGVAPPSSVSRKSLHIAWIGFAPAEETGGVPGIATDLLHGLAKLGHRIDCFFPSHRHELPPLITDLENLTVVWGMSGWQWNRWYSRTRLTAFVSSLIARSVASLRLRAEVARRHRDDPYDLFYQFSNVENLAMPRTLRRSVPLVVHPGQSSADALRFLIKERRLQLQRRAAHAVAIAAAVIWLRMRVQRRSVRRARLVVCISEVFRDHLIRDYGLSRQDTVVVPNPVRLDRFEGIDTDRPLGRPPRIVVLGRIATGKGIEDVVALAKLLLERKVDARIRLVGGTSVWSNYTHLLDDLPAENSEYVGFVPGSQVPGELAESDLLLQASKYEAFALTVAEALAAGVPVVATTEVGAIEQVDRSVCAAVAPGDVPGMAAAIVAMLERLGSDPRQLRSLARAEAERLFAPERVSREISAALQRYVEGVEHKPIPAG
jgi:glycosyltransferase involved in cell wall biosynthesis